jgi:hypothetical protein
MGLRSRCASCSSRSGELQINRPAAGNLSSHNSAILEIAVSRTSQNSAFEAVSICVEPSVFLAFLSKAPLQAALGQTNLGPYPADRRCIIPMGASHLILETSSTSHCSGRYEIRVRSTCRL